MEHMGKCSSVSEAKTELSLEVQKPRDCKSYRRNRQTGTSNAASQTILLSIRQIQILLFFYHLVRLM